MVPPRVHSTLLAALDHADTAGWTKLALTLEECLEVAPGCSLEVVPARRHEPAIGELRPTDRRAANPRSLSALVGLEPFPLHTDGASCKRPPGYVLLCAGLAIDGEDTLLWSPNAEDFNDAARHGMFAVSGRPPFLAPAVDADGRLRFDPGCMRPCDGLAKRTAARFAERAADAQRHSWTESTHTLVIANRRTMHGRTATSATSNRLLRRLMLRRRDVPTV